jgi:predicted ATPase
MNGSGKSTVLEALAEIFSNVFTVVLQKNSKKLSLNFDFELEYSLIENDKELTFKITHQKGQIIDILSNIDIYENWNLALPNNITIYYSGFSDIMQKIVNPYNQKLQDEYRNGNYLAKSPFFYFTPAHFNIILATLFSYEYGDIPQFLQEKLNIKQLSTIIIDFKKPTWAKNNNIRDWFGAKGEVRRFLDYIQFTLAKEIKEGDIQGEVNVVDTINNEKRIIRIVGQEALFKIREYFGDEKDLFNMLNVMHLEGLLYNIDVNFEKNNEKNIIQNLSEGEQQLIVIKGLTELLKGENTLFLFDEPDVYLHPKWQGEFIKNISEGNTENAQYVITTHSTVMLSNLKQGDLFRMKNGKAQRIESGYYGKDYGDNLENYFEVAGRNEEATDDLANLFQLIDEEKFEKATQVLENLQLKYPNEPELTRAQTLITLLQDDPED